MCRGVTCHFAHTFPAGAGADRLQGKADWLTLTCAKSRDLGGLGVCFSGVGAWRGKREDTREGGRSSSAKAGKDRLKCSTAKKDLYFIPHAPLDVSPLEICADVRLTHLIEIDPISNRVGLIDAAYGNSVLKSTCFLLSIL